MIAWRTAGPAVALVTLVACLEASAGGDIERIDPAVADHSEAVVAEVAAGFDAFGFALWDELRAGSSEPNVVLSPLSAASALSLVLAGAADGTADEIAGALGVDPNAPADGRVGSLLVALAEGDDVDLTLANAVWTLPDYPLTDVFRATAGDALGATVDERDLADADEVDAVDEWAVERTDGLIDEISDTLGLPNSQAVAVLANATHFAGTWTTEFDPDETREGEFTRDDGSTVTAELMEAQEMDLAVAAEPDGEVLLARLPYGESERFGFEVLVPTDDTPLAEVLDEVDVDRWRELSQRATEEEDLRVVLPRFAVESEHDLVEPLQALGIERAFGRGSDFTPMSPRNPFLGEVAQKAVIEVDESGTEAAAVTGAVMLESASAISEVVVDRSFAFAVRDAETGASLFLGVVDDPTA